MARASARERLRDSAMALFEKQGYQATTIEQIVEDSGVSRTTFFRLFGSKDDVIFPDHEQILTDITEHLTQSHESPIAAVAGAAKMVLRRYLTEGETARARYRLTRSEPALRARETSIIGSYQQRLRRHLAGQLGHGPDDQLDAELISAAVVAAHNHVLRRWLRGETADPDTEYDKAVDHLTALFTSTPEHESPDSAVLVLTRRADLAAVLPRLRAALDGDPS